MTAVEWLDRWFRDNPEATYEEGNKALQQAKEMESEQKKKIVDDAIKNYELGLADRKKSLQVEISNEEIEKKVFEIAGKRRINFPITMKECYRLGLNDGFYLGAKWYRDELKLKKCNFFMEIEDMEIEEWAKKESKIEPTGAEEFGRIMGAKWYREQLKQRQ